jgi:hypothetical protein
MIDDNIDEIIKFVSNVKQRSKIDINYERGEIKEQIGVNTWLLHMKFGDGGYGWLVNKSDFYTLFHIEKLHNGYFVLIKSIDSLEPHKFEDASY